MNEEMEAAITEMHSRPENLAVSEDANVDEAIPIDLRKELWTESWKEKRRKDDNNLGIYKTRAKLNTTNWEPIYEVIDQAYIKNSKMFWYDSNK